MVQPWITTDDIIDGDDPSSAWAIDAASWILYKLTGEKYTGIVQTTEVYSSRLSSSTSVNFPTTAQVSNGEITHASLNSRGSSRLRLKHTPVRSIEAVYVGGHLLDPSEYQLRNNTYLVRKGGKSWTSSSRSELEITYTHGTMPPSMGIAAAIRLANELIWSDQDSDQCTLPERISSSVSRQGVSYTVLDPQDFLDKGRTGITIVDMFINAANPSGAKKRARIFTADGLKAERIN